MAPMGIAGQTTIGVRGGFTSATVSGDDLTGRSRRSGFTVGGSVRFGLGEAFGLEVGAAYTQKGVAAIDGGTDMSVDFGYVVVRHRGFALGTGFRDTRKGELRSLFPRRWAIPPDQS